MNTIIYLYEHRRAEQFVTDKWQENDYCLIRLGVPGILWKQLKEAEEETEAFLSVKANRFSFFGRRKQAKTCRKSHELAEELEGLQTALILLGDNPHWTYCVYDETFKDKLESCGWHKYWKIPEFINYHERIWVQKLLPCAIPGRYVILGYSDCMPLFLCENAGKLRSVKWYLRPEEDTPELQNFMEEFYEEYGLAIEQHVVRESWFRVRPASDFPATVFDFTGEEKLSACDMADGSIWLDMDSLDGKNRRIEARNPEIRYFSMKKLWKQRQKEGICLDTINKNGYNTIVK